MKEEKEKRLVYEKSYHPDGNVLYNETKASGAKKQWDGGIVLRAEREVVHELSS